MESSIKKQQWGSLFSYVDHDHDEESCMDNIVRYYNIVLLKDFHDIHAGTEFYQVEMDVSIGTLKFGNLVDCPTNECGKDLVFTEALVIT